MCVEKEAVCGRLWQPIYTREVRGQCNRRSNVSFARVDTICRLVPPKSKDISAFKKPLQVLDSGESISYMWESDLPAELMETLHADDAEDSKMTSRLESELENWSFEPLTLRISNIDDMMDESSMVKALSVYGRVIQATI